MSSDKNIELTILMPCLDEAETLEICIKKAQKYITDNSIRGEVLISDNGSTDGSIQIAESLGARVTHATQKGYGAALINGINDAYGTYIIMGDCDDSYDFSDLNNYMAELRNGHDLVMGNRFKGGIGAGAMPILHKYLGNPVLSFIGRLFFKIPVKDFHCGLRGFNREKIKALKLRTPGMEFASEMVVKSALNDYSIIETPTTLTPDGRTRPPHLNTWSDGWRHLRFLLMYSPKWLFMYPALFALFAGLGLTALLLPGTFSVSSNVTLGMNSLIAACFLILMGLQGLSFAIISRRYAAMRGLLPEIDDRSSFIEKLSLEKVLIFCVALFITGTIGFVNSLMTWFSVGLGPLEVGSLTKTMALSGTSITAAIQIAFSFFLAEIISIKSDYSMEN